MCAKLIAHRGGVVSSPADENSLHALEEAAARGYYGVEMDLRETRDHVVVLHHNPYLAQAFGRSEPISSLSYDEIVEAGRRAEAPPPPTLEQAAAGCRGRLQVMIELKEPKPSRHYLEHIAAVLRDYGLMGNALAIGSPAGREYFLGWIKTSIRCRRLAQMADALDRARLGSERFLFDHGNVITPEDLRRAQALGILVVPSINLFHYRGEDPMAGAQRDARNLLQAGVDTFQIDSRFETFFH
jgi:glycerophosphoryl diester phosphodiesterase